MSEHEAPDSAAVGDLRAVVSEIRDELTHAAKIDALTGKLTSMHGDLTELRGEVRRLVQVGESLATVGQWAMKWTPWIVGALAGANLLDLHALIAALGVSR